MIQTDLSGGRRTKRGDLETAVYTLHRATDNRTITLVGTVHMAEADYYQQLRAIVDDLVESGAEVHCEGGRAVDDSEYQTLDEAAAVKQLRASIDVVYQQAIDAFGLPWTFQATGPLRPAPTWQRFDVKDLEVVRLLGPGRSGEFDHMEASVRKMIGAHARKAGRPRLQKLMVGQFVKAYIRTQCRLLPSKTLLWAINTARLVIRKPPVGPRREEVAVFFVYREYQAALAALSAGKDVVMVWHANHQPGLASVLLRNDFTIQETQWLPAIHMS